MVFYNQSTLNHDESNEIVVCQQLDFRVCLWVWLCIYRWCPSISLDSELWLRPAWWFSTGCCHWSSYAFPGKLSVLFGSRLLLFT